MATLTVLPKPSIQSQSTGISELILVANMNVVSGIWDDVWRPSSSSSNSGNTRFASEYEQNIPAVLYLQLRAGIPTFPQVTTGQAEQVLPDGQFWVGWVEKLLFFMNSLVLFITDHTWVVFFNQCGWILSNYWATNQSGNTERSTTSTKRLF